MRLLLLSLGDGAVPDFLSTNVKHPTEKARVGYLNDASRMFADAWFVAAERDRVAALGCTLVDLTAGDYDRAHDFDTALAGLDALYVAGGNTFTLLAALRRNGTDDVIVDRVRSGLPYIGSSAGSVITGPSIEPVSLLDDPADAPGLTDYTGLGFIDTIVIPHADGALPPYPPELFTRIKQTYGADYPLTFLNDDQALLVNGDSVELIPSPDNHRGSQPTGGASSR